MSNYTASKSDKLIQLNLAKEQADDSFSNVKQFPNEGDTPHKPSNQEKSPVTGVSYGGQDNPLKEDISKEGMAIGTSVKQPQPSPDYRKKNYPGEYKCWDNMKQRCRTKGYVLDPRFKKFSDFMSYLGPRPGKEYSIDRIDYKNPEYSPENTRWASKKLQTANRCNTRMFTDNNDLCLSALEWSNRGPKVPAKTILNRVDVLGWTHHEAVHTPKNQRRKPANGPEYISPDADKYASLFVQMMKDVHGETIVPVTKADRAMLNKIAVPLAAGGVRASQALWLVLKYWTLFTRHADRRYGFFDPPEVPTIKYMTRALCAIGSFHAKNFRAAERQRLKEEEEDRRHQRDLARTKWMKKYVSADPEVKDLKKRIKAHNKKRNSSNGGMTETEWKKIETNLAYEEDWLFQSRDFFKEAMKAWRCKQEK